MSELNQIKKRLYKTVSFAKFQHIYNGIAFYKSELHDGKLTGDGQAENIDETVNFEIPISDMGTSHFLDRMESKYLIRWIVNY